MKFTFIAVVVAAVTVLTADAGAVSHGSAEEIAATSADYIKDSTSNLDSSSANEKQDGASFLELSNGVEEEEKEFGEEAQLAGEGDFGADGVDESDDGASFLQEGEDEEDEDMDEDDDDEDYEDGDDEVSFLAEFENEDTSLEGLSATQKENVQSLAQQLTEAERAHVEAMKALADVDKEYEDAHSLGIV